MFFADGDRYVTFLVSGNLDDFCVRKERMVDMLRNNMGDTFGFWVSCHILINEGYWYALFLFLTFIMVGSLGSHDRHPHGFKASWKCLPQQQVIC